MLCFRIPPHPHPTQSNSVAENVENFRTLFRFQAQLSPTQLASPEGGARPSVLRNPQRILLDSPGGGLETLVRQLLLS